MSFFDSHVGIALTIANKKTNNLHFLNQGININCAHKVISSTNNVFWPMFNFKKHVFSRYFCFTW